MTKIRCSRTFMASFVLCAFALLAGGWVAAAIAQEPVLAVIADYGVGAQSEADVASLVASWNPDAVLTAGDNCYAPGDHLTNVDPYYGGFVDEEVLFPAIGDHDQTDCGGLAAYQAYFNVPRYYDVVVGPVHAFLLNSELDEPDGVTADSPQAEWLRLGLEQSTAPWKLVILHHPPFSSGVEHGSHPHLQWPFAEWGASAVLSGDDHLYERLLVEGLPYFVVGLGGAVIHDFAQPLPESVVRYNADYGAMRLDASSESITFAFYTRTGELVDSYTLEAGMQPQASLTEADSQAQ
jgi:tartrate-resistant acid phosphatase type 5